MCVRSVPISWRVDRPVFEDISESENASGRWRQTNETNRTGGGRVWRRRVEKKTDMVRIRGYERREAEEEEGDRFVGISTAF